MTDQLTVNAELEEGAVVLTVDYGPEQMFQQEGSKALSEEFLKKYNEATQSDGSSRSSIVVVEADTAGSPLLKALFDLYKKVTAERKQLICVGYPRAYIRSLTTLGLLSLSGFKLAESKKAALEILKQQEKK